jgi:pilus assembly protein CpaB
MNGRTIMLLTLAVGFGLGAMFLTRQLLSDDSSKKPEETQEIVVAARDFKEEEILKPEMLKMMVMVKSAIPVGAFSSIKDVEDRWVRSTMFEGDVLVEKKLGAKGAPPGLVANIPKGMRGYAIEVTEQTGVSGFILPGHRVDVLHYEQSEKKEVHAQAQAILQNVLVLAAGQVFTRPEERSLPTRTVTMALSPSDVEVLVAARGKGGMLSLSLRGVNDNEVVKRAIPPVTTVAAPVEDDPRWKIEEEKRQKLERELNNLKELVAKKATEIPKPPPPSLVPTVTQPSSKFVWIYRSAANQPQKVRADKPVVSALTAPSPLDEDADVLKSARPFGTDPTEEAGANEEPRS